MAARTVMENHYGRALSDREWESTKRDLVAFVRLLMEWERRAVDQDAGSPDGVSAQS
jgi:hypothetical protein